MEKPKILLINPTQGLNINRPVKPKFQSHPLGLLYIASMLKKNDYNVEILDACNFGCSMEEIKNRIIALKPDIVGITAMTILAPSAYIIAKEIKKINPSIVTVMGGPHATAMPEEALKEGCMDFVVLGEGEYTMLELCDMSSRGNKNYQAVKGISYKTGSSITNTGTRPFVMNIDRIPFPDYGLLSQMKRYNPPPHWGKRGAFATVITSRGCPYGCMFCSVTRTWGKRYRYRSAENVLKELKLLHEKYSVKYISLRDSVFTLYKQRVIDICKGIIKNKLDIKWNCNAHAKEVNEEVLAWMKKAGCELIQYGIEQGDESMLKKFKRLDKETIKNAIAITNRAGIKAHGYFMFGMPGETRDTIRATLSFAKNLPLYSAGFTTVTPFPGSDLWDYAVKNSLIITKDWSRYSVKNLSVVRYANFKSQDILRSQKRAFREFYLRPKILFYHFAKIKSLNDLLNYVKGALINLK
ncbi:MAG: cobalamin-dependent protein [Candidatus Omnitrophica bacterium]|nr:cobalamin-dependent protein [Candidatus Omnitrophota bacterium]